MEITDLPSKSELRACLKQNTEREAGEGRHRKTFQPRGPTQECLPWSQEEVGTCWVGAAAPAAPGRHSGCSWTSSLLSQPRVGWLPQPREPRSPGKENGNMAPAGQISKTVRGWTATSIWEVTEKEQEEGGGGGV